MKAACLCLTSLILASSLAAQSAWRNLGHAKAGSAGYPDLSAVAPQLGASFTITLASARPSSLAALVLSTRRSDLPIWGGVLVPAADAVFLLPTSVGGGASMLVNVPNDQRLLAATVYLQSVVADPLATQGLAFSNALTANLCPQLRFTAEDFRTDRFFDPQVSAGTWGGGALRFSLVGGSGILGVFDPRHGTQVAPGHYVWSTDRQIIPGSATRTGSSITVTDGRFHFESLTIPANVRVDFVGSNPARIWVSGDAVIDGRLTTNGEVLAADRVAPNKAAGPQAGEVGGVAGAMGGTGGAGGDRGDGLVHKSAFDGKPGTDVVLKAGHAYAAAARGTGGLGSPQFPADGRDASIGWGYVNVIALELNRGGGGGGFTGPGGAGTAVWGPPNTAYAKWAAPGSTPGGIALDFPSTFPTYTNGFTHADHFLVGGSGGGGGGSCSTATIHSATPKIWWRIGRAGGGGGGALGLRIGGSLHVAGAIEARGGAGAFDDLYFSVRGLMAAGGGGSGGSVFAQVNRAIDNRGSVSTEGGAGGQSVGHPLDAIFNGAASRGGDGAPGIVHFEVGGDPRSYTPGTTVPPNAPISRIEDTDFDVAFVRSRWYPTTGGAAPTFLRYEIEATVDGKPVVFTDDPARGPLASGPSSPLRLTVQGATVGLATSGHWEPVGLATPWIEFVGPFAGTKPTLFGSGTNGYRFELVLDRSVTRDVVVHKITVFWCR
ncbi:MAG: hypothetical protein KDC87_03095 [Planctomycetes bacterium]|nr:hypothetical protein [Planctomycetota bacterium]